MNGNFLALVSGWILLEKLCIHFAQSANMPIALFKDPWLKRGGSSCSGRSLSGSGLMTPFPNQLPRLLMERTDLTVLEAMRVRFLLLITSREWFTFRSCSSGVCPATVMLSRNGKAPCKFSSSTTLSMARWRLLTHSSLRKEFYRTGVSVSWPQKLCSSCLIPSVESGGRHLQVKSWEYSIFET